MRLTTIATTTLSATAALALLTACGGSDEESTASSTSASTTSAAESSADIDPEAAAFCSDAETAFTDLESVGSSTDVSTIPGLLAQASEQLDAIEPPAEISESWTTLTAALDQTVVNIQGLDLTTPEGQQAFLTEVTALQSTATDAQTEVEDYVTANCDIADPSSSAAPTS